MKRLLILTLLSLCLGWYPTSPAAASHRPPATIRILSSEGKELSKFTIPTANEASGVSLAVGDLGSDGVPEIIVGSGLGNPPEIRVLRKDGSQIGKFLAYKANMGLGINVAVCDLDGDGINEIVTSPQRGGGPHIRVFDNLGAAIGEGFFAYDTASRSGVNIACGDLDGVAGAELVTLPATNGGALVKIWKQAKDGYTLAHELTPFGNDSNTGMVGLVHERLLTVVTQRGTTAYVKRVQASSPVIVTDQPSADLGATGVTNAFLSNGALMLATSSNSQLIDVTNQKITKTQVPFGALTAVSADMDSDGKMETIVGPAKPILSDKYPDKAKAIIVDLSEQRLYAYENGVLANTFLVATGKGRWATPQGEVSVLDKVWQVHYRWSYGPNDPNNYDLGVVKYNLRIRPHIYIHYAPWHNNFGHVTSHGCVNVNFQNAKWIYEWAEKDIPVNIQA